MLTCTAPAERPILVAASAPEDARLTEEALDELMLSSVRVPDGIEAMQLLCRRPNTYGAVIVGERVGRVSGWTLSGLARDAGCRLPILLITGDECRLAAARAARLRVTLLWRPASAGRVARALTGMLPRRPCGAQAGGG